MKNILIFVTFFISTHILAKDLVVGINHEIAIKDPINLKYVEEWESYAGFWGTLAVMTKDEGVAHGLAKKWSIDDKIGITFELKDTGLDNGEKVTSKDVLASLKRLLIKDTKNKIVLSRCLLIDKKIKSVNDNHPSFVLINEKEFLVKIKKSCMKNILYEFSMPIYGITSIKSIKKDNSIDYNNFRSAGLYQLTNKKPVVLSVNPNHWVWKRVKPKINKIIYKVVNKKTLKNTNLDLYRDHNLESYQFLKKKKYNYLFSLPVNTVYMVPDLKKHKDISKIKNKISKINNSYEQLDFAYFKERDHEQKSSDFFPKDFNCTYSKKKKVLKATNFCVSLEKSKGFEDLAVELESKLNVRLNCKKGEKILHMKIMRNFLGAKVNNILNLVFNNFKQIQDPSGKMKQYINSYEQAMNSSEKKELLKKSCNEFYQMNHVPLLHRSSILFAKDKKYLSLYSRVTGNFFINEIPALD